MSSEDTPKTGATLSTSNEKVTKRPYVKPAIEHDEELDVFVLTCSAHAVGTSSCQLN